MRPYHLTLTLITTAMLAIANTAIAGSSSHSSSARTFSQFSSLAGGPSTSYAPRSHSQPHQTISSGQTTISTISNRRIAGMGADERLCPTKCPVSVYNPEGGKVLACFSVCKPVAAPAPRPVYRQVRIAKPVYRQVRIVRPVIYVPYSVPVLAPMPVQSCRTGAYDTRYGQNWPGRPCGW